MLVLDLVVRSFLGDDNVVDVAFTQAAGGDLHHLGLLVEFVQSGGAKVAHAGTQAADELVDGVGHRAASGHATDDALGHQLLGGVLEIAVGGAHAHGVDGAHAAVGLIHAALIQHGFARAFVGAGEHGTEHDGMGTGGESLDDVAGVLDAAVGDAAAVGFTGGAAAFHDGADLGHAHTGHHAGGADGAGADAHLHGVRTGLDEGLGGFVGGDVASDELDAGEGGTEHLDSADDVGGMAVGGVEHEHVGTGGEQFGGAVFAVLADADGGAHAQAALVVLAGVGVFLHLVDVLHGDEAAQLAVVIHDEELFDAVGVQMMLGFFERSTDGHSDEVVAGHHFADEGLLSFGDEAHVAVGKDTHEGVVLHHGEAGNAELAHEFKGVLHGIVGGDGHGVEDHAAFGLLHLFHFEALAGHIHILMDDADAALTSHGNGHFGFRNGIHGGRNEGDAQLDAGGQPCRNIDHVRGDFRVFGHQKDIVESKRFTKHCGHICLQLD